MRLIVRSGDKRERTSYSQIDRTPPAPTLQNNRNITLEI